MTRRRAFAPGWVAERSDYPQSVLQPEAAVLLDEGDLVPDLVPDRLLAKTVIDLPAKARLPSTDGDSSRAHLVQHAPASVV